MLSKNIKIVYALLVFCSLMSAGIVESSVLTTESPIKIDNHTTVILPFFNKPNQQYVSRGQMLYENHCTACHKKQVYTRVNRKAKNIQQIKFWIIRHSRNFQLNWRNDEINAVTLYLSEHHYGYSGK